MTLSGVRVAGVLRLTGAHQEKLAAAQAGEIVALARMEGVATGAALATGAAPSCRGRHCRSRSMGWRSSPRSVPTTSSSPPPSPSSSRRTRRSHLEQSAEMQEMVLWGQGDIHLQIAHRPAAQQVQPAGDVRASRSPLQGDDPQGHGALPLQAPVRRPRPVRRHPDRGAAAAARHRPHASPMRWWAAPSRATTFPPSRKGCWSSCATVPSAFPWSTYR